MSDYIDQDETTEESSLVKDLRKQLAQANKRLKAIEDEKRDSTLNTVLAKVPADKREKAKRLIGDTDPNEWYAEFGDLFGAPEAPSQETPTEAPAPQEETTSTAAAHQAISNAMSGGSSPEQVTRFEQKIADYADPNELVNYLNSVMRTAQGQV